MAQQPWRISIDNFLGGLANGYWKNDYPSYGNKNQAGKLQNVDITDPAGIKPGPSLVNLTNGTQAAAVTTLIKRIMDSAVTSLVTYAAGGAKLYQISNVTVTNAGIWPHTVDKATVTSEDITDVTDYEGNLYYVYNYLSDPGADIGKYDLNTTTFDDDWGSTVPTGAAVLTGDVPHKFVKGEGYLYITNGNKMAQYTGASTNTLSTAKLTLPTGFIISSAEYSNSKFYIASNPSSLSGANRIDGQISVWDGTSPTQVDMVIPVSGRVGATFLQNGIVFVFHQDATSTGGYALGYISGNQIKDVAFYSGSLPEFYQVTKNNGLITWVSGGLIYTWGSVDSVLPVALSQYMDGGYSTVGAIAAPFGTLLVASNETTSYKIAYASTIGDSTAYWKSLAFDVSKNTDRGFSLIKKVIINLDTLPTGGEVKVTITSDNATAWTKDIDTAGTNQAIFNPQIQCKWFRIELSWENSVATTDVVVNSIEITGVTL